MNNLIVRKGVSYNVNNEVVSCLFCRIVKREEPADILFDSETTSVFKTIAPYTSAHYLVVPKKHIPNVASLTPNDLDTIIELKQVAEKVLSDNEANQGGNSRLVFHVPPFNSIDHLHLHAIGNTRELSFWGHFKYTAGLVWCEGVDSVISRLEKEAEAARSRL